MWVQTSFPTHPLFACLKRHDFAAFAALELSDRAQAGMPPFSFQALIRADARTQDIAQGYLTAAKDACQVVNGAELVTLYPAVPLTVQRVANVERAQMLVECQSRPALQAFLAAWRPVLHEIRSQQAFKGLIRWAIDVDPQLI
jgi:primosomal protein N' (replication factor Y)